jgi:hypothetical protein
MKWLRQLWGETCFEMTLSKLTEPDRDHRCFVGFNAV